MTVICTFAHGYKKEFIDYEWFGPRLSLALPSWTSFEN